MKTFQKTLQFTLFSTLACATFIHAQPAEEAWKKLVGKKQAERAVFSYVENDSALPNILIYGDSISISYTQRVREKLAGKANVYRIHTNGGESGSFIKKMDSMHQAMSNKDITPPWSFKWDVIHFNVGLHDLKYTINGKLAEEGGKQVASIEIYKKNLESIKGYLDKLAPEATLIFATTTPVPEHAKGRFAGDGEKYNTAAMEVFAKHPDVVINDLFSLTKPNHEKWWSKAGNVHYKKKGSNAQGDKVATVLLEALEKLASKN